MIGSFLLPLAVLSAKSRLIPLTVKSFPKIVEKRPKHEIWIVMLHTNSNFLSKKLFPKFQEASDMTSGMFKFGLVDTKEQPLLARQLRTKQIPTYLIYHAKGVTEYVGDGEPNDIIEFARQFIPDKTIEIDESWLEKNSRTKAILFTELEYNPSLWIGVAHVFSRRGVKVGVCRNFELAEKFNITKLPSILFLNSTCSYVYNGKIDFPNIKNTLEEFADGKFKINTIKKEVLSSNRFGAECIDGKYNCVLGRAGVSEEEWDSLRKRYSGLKIKWFYGDKELPWPFLEDSNFWIYNPQIDGFAKTDDLASIGPMIEQVHDGTMKWRVRSEIQEEDDL